MGSVTYDGRLYGALLDGCPRPHFGTIRQWNALAVGPRWSGLGRVLVLVRTPRPRGPQGVRGNTVSADAANAIDAHNLHRQRTEYPMALGHIWDLRLDQSGGAL